MNHLKRVTIFTISLLLLFSSASIADELGKRITNSKEIQDIQKKLEAFLDKKPFEVWAYLVSQDLQIFNNYQLINITAYHSGLEDPFLEHPMLPTGGSWGTFAYDGKHLIYLSQSKDNLEKILTQEKIIGNSKINPEALAKIIIMTLIDKLTRFNELIQSPQGILSYEKYKGTATDYKVDRQKLKKLKKKIKPPFWKDSGNKKILTFFCLSGWMHKKNTINKFTVSFDKNSSILEIKKETLVDKIFNKIPSIMY